MACLGCGRRDELAPETRFCMQSDMSRDKKLKHVLTKTFTHRCHCAARAPALLLHLTASGAGHAAAAGARRLAIIEQLLRRRSAQSARRLRLRLGPTRHGAAGWRLHVGSRQGDCVKADARMRRGRRRRRGRVCTAQRRRGGRRELRRRRGVAGGGYVALRVHMNKQTKIENARINRYGNPSLRTLVAES